MVLMVLRHEHAGGRTRDDLRVKEPLVNVRRGRVPLDGVKGTRPIRRQARAAKRKCSVKKTVQGIHGEHVVAWSCRRLRCPQHGKGRCWRLRFSVRRLCRASASEVRWTLMEEFPGCAFCGSIAPDSYREECSPSNETVRSRRNEWAIDACFWLQP